MHTLREKHCVACEGDVPVLGKTDVERFLAEVEGWSLAEAGKGITKDLVFKNFDKAMDFVNMVADTAEQEGHHPDIQISYNKVHLFLTTHSIGGLSENDFILASKIDGIRL